MRSCRGRPLGAEGVMTKRYFFPVHRMDVYQKFARLCAAGHRLAP